ncbi:UDP-glucose--hexose-1-phosphate uridylyltransferase [Sediminibacillus albus]|uniref:Galactose-1-phosphate uridylyltransferase n=1 Tax=Sediminibacillus albus TaxID=407036 RepID=A0A1G8ZU21_9BACI|nr:UDP-glucose--hexose-1-phosphate uridylyltransferase [Sediminibacillus albus]SDK18568.1 UDPglucose--hexose-1-phosphate uridylyltransferase [Sediminibacillus albus]
MSVYRTISNLIDNAIKADLIEPCDRVYVRNQILGLLHLNDYQDEEGSGQQAAIPDLIEELVGTAVENNVIEDVLDDKEIFAANLMNIFLPKPSVINQLFTEKWEQSPKEATNYFYQLSKNSNYIQMKRISKNIHFKADTSYGTLDITINLSKPEKDPEQIKREKQKKQKINYPRCVLCIENEGYVGRVGHPARSNHRIVKLDLEGENWYLQFSPYVYYNQHSIVLAEEHRDMKIDRSTFERLTAFVEKFPHYFIGSNADLPIVGGSILSHDHYQAGSYSFAMDKASELFSFALNKFPKVEAAVMEWPLSVIRLKSSRRQDLIAAADHILHKWKAYSDASVNIKAFSNGDPHNTVTPIARLKNGQYEMDLVLRNNRTNEQHPMGIFHPHQDVHHIKKENIGLIEVMGLAVLPARLKTELEKVKSFLLGETTTVPEHHRQWAEDIKRTNQISKATIDRTIQQELGNKFARVLEDAGVFKQDKVGRQAFKRFISILNNE